MQFSIVTILRILSVLVSITVGIECGSWIFSGLFELRINFFELHNCGYNKSGCNSRQVGDVGVWHAFIRQVSHCSTWH